MKHLWCWLVGHRWKIVRRVYRGSERTPHRITWKCDRRRIEKETHHG